MVVVGCIRDDGGGPDESGVYLIPVVYVWFFIFISELVGDRDAAAAAST